MRQQSLKICSIINMSRLKEILKSMYKNLKRKYKEITKIITILAKCCKKKLKT
jgi:hypothetical protein